MDICVGQVPVVEVIVVVVVAECRVLCVFM
jgi:hypothetical protein